MSEKQLSKEQPPKPIGDECDGSDSENGEKMTDMYQGMKDKMTRDSDSEEECDAVVREPISAQITSSSSKAIGEEAAAVTKPAVTKKTKSSTENAPVSKKLFLDFAHSPNALAVNKSLAIWKFNDSNSSQLQIKSTKRIGNELKTEFKGNAKKGTVHSLKASSGINSHGVNIGLRIKGIQGDIIGNNLSEPVLMTVGPGQSMTFEVGLLTHKNQSANDPLLKQFGNVTESAIDSCYRLRLDDEQHCDVKIKSAITEAAMSPKNAKFHKKYGGISFGPDDKTFIMETSDVMKIVSQLKSLVNNLPIMDLTLLEAEIVRMDGRAWGDPAGVVGIINPNNKNEVTSFMNATKNCSFTLEIEYSLADS